MKYLLPLLLPLLSCCIYAENTRTESFLVAENDNLLSPDELIQNAGIIFSEENSETVFNILTKADGKLLQSMCMRELASREGSVNFLKNKMGKDSPVLEKDYAAEILLNMSNFEAQLMASEYYIDQLNNMNYHFKNIYNYPQSARIGMLINIPVNIDDQSVELIFHLSEACIPLLQLGAISLPRLIATLDSKSSVFASYNAYWLIEHISGIKLPSFGKVWQNSNLAKEIISLP
jgi:hypothetical protein